MSEQELYKDDVSGILSDKTIKKYIQQGEIEIHPFEEKNLTPIGYNLTASEFILSINQQLLVDIHIENDEKYCYIAPNDTVLIITREAVKVSNKIAGTFHSRVSVVSKGLGHISTTLDPSWQGALLVSLNNPTTRPIKLILGQTKKVTQTSKNKIKFRGTLRFRQLFNQLGNKDKKVTDTIYLDRAFVTLVFYRLIDEPLNVHDNPSGRFDILKYIMDTPPKKKFWTPWKNNITHYETLKELIGKIGSLSFIKPNNNDDEYTKEDFQRNYDYFSSTLKFYTDKARTATKQIKNKRNKVKRFKRIGLWTLLTIIFLAIIYVLWRIIYNHNNNNTTALMSYLGLIIMATQVALAVVYGKKNERDD